MNSTRSIELSCAQVLASKAYRPLCIFMHTQVSRFENLTRTVVCLELTARSCKLCVQHSPYGSLTIHDVDIMWLCEVFAAVRALIYVYTSFPIRGTLAINDSDLRISLFPHTMYTLQPSPSPVWSYLYNDQLADRVHSTQTLLHTFKLV